MPLLLRRHPAARASRWRLGIGILNVTFSGPAGRQHGGVRLTVEESNRAYRSGFIYLPHADVRKNSRRSYQYVGGGWWAWREEG